MPDVFFFTFLSKKLYQYKATVGNFYLKINAKIIKFYSVDGHFDLVRISLDAALGQLPAGQFTPTNRSFAIAKEYLETIEKEFVTLIGVPDVQIPVSKRYYGDLVAEVKVIEALTSYDV